METIRKKGKELTPEEIKKIEKQNKEIKPTSKKEVKPEEPKKKVEPPVSEELEPLYQRKVYLIDLQNAKIDIKGEEEMIVDVIAVEKDKAVVRYNNEEFAVPRDFLFNL